MTLFVVPPPEPPSAAVAGSAQRFPLRRVFCVGRNYAAHAREMGKDPTREAPFFFMKPADAVVPASGVIPYPMLTANFHHEVELVVAIGGHGLRVAPGAALGLVWGYGAGVDLTRRDLQEVAKAMSRPWEWSKAFDASAPISPLHPASVIGHPAAGRIWLEVNGEPRQQGDLQDLIWPVADIVSHISHSVALRPGDLIFTGTPAGVGALHPGDQVRGGVDGVAEFAFEIGPAVASDRRNPSA